MHVFPYTNEHNLHQINLVTGIPENISNAHTRTHRSLSQTNPYSDESNIVRFGKSNEDEVIFSWSKWC